MKVSVIIPTYRPSDYLFRCLDSLQGQTLVVTEWEMLIVLNGCNEPWHSQVSSYLKNHHINNARILQTDTAGVSNARNIGLEEAKGEYIAFVDDDDCVSNTYLEQLVGKAQKDTISLSNTTAFSSAERYIPYYIEQEYSRRARYGKQPFYKAKKYFGGPCMKLIHRDIIGNIRFDTRFSNGEDSLFMYAISKNIRYVDFTSQDAIYFRRMRTDSASKGETGWTAVKNRLQLMHEYSAIYWTDMQAYRFGFYITRILGSIHSILLKI